MTSLSQRIAALQAQRGRLVARFEGLITRALDEDREFDDEENEERLTLRGQIEALDRRIETHAADETILARQALPIPVVYPGNTPGTSVVLRTQRERPHIQMRRNDDYKGAGFTRWAIAMCVAGPWNAAEYARQRWGDDELADIIAYANWFARAATPPIGTGPGGPGGPGEGLGGPLGGASLIRLEHLGEEFIELLRPLLIVARLPSMRRLQFNGAGTLLIPRQSGGVAGGYVGEGGHIMVQRLSFGQLQLTPSKLAVIVPMTNEMLHRADPGIEQLVRDDMLQGTARTIDTVFFSEVGAGAGPAGILFGIPQNTPAGDIGAGANVGAVTDALRAMIYALRGQNVPMLAPVWIMNARTKEYLRLLRSALTDIFAFKAEIDAGTLLGFPIIDSTNIAINAAVDTPWPGPVGTTVYSLIDASQLLWAEDMLPLIDASQDASILSSDFTPPPAVGFAPPSVIPPGGVQGAPTANYPGFSAFQNDMTLLRIRMRHTWNRRHDVAITWATTAE